MQFPSNVYNPIFDALRLVHNRGQVHESSGGRQHLNLAQLRTIQKLPIRVKANNRPTAAISGLYNSPGPGANML